MTTITIWLLGGVVLTIVFKLYEIALVQYAMEA